MNMRAKTIPSVLIVLLLWGGAVSCQSKPEASVEVTQSEGVVNVDVNVAAFAALMSKSDSRNHGLGPVKISYTFYHKTRVSFINDYGIVMRKLPRSAGRSART